MKKAFYILFAFYFALLTLTPCGDRQDCNERKKSELCQTSHGHEDEKHQDEDCTPLCTCSCCSALFLITEGPVGIRQVAEINTVYTIHSISPETGAIIPIWQPPKIG